MAAHTTETQPNPELIFEEFNGYQRTVALKGAIDLELFTLIDEGVTGTAELASKAQASERGVRILCDFLTIRGFLTKSGGAYGLTATSKMFLSKRSPAYMGSMSGFLASDHIFSLYQDVAGTVRRGGGQPTDNGLAPDHPMWVEFAKSMAPMARMVGGAAARILAEPAEPLKVLDIAAGHGFYGISIAQANPASHVVGLDWDNVLAVARANAQNTGIGDRYSTITGSAFEVDFGTGYDLILLPNFCHHFDEAANLGLFKKIWAALKPGGRVAIIEFIPNEDRVTPHTAAAFSFVMLNVTPSGDAYTYAEYDRMLGLAGFTGIAHHDLAPAPQRMVVAVA